VTEVPEGDLARVTRERFEVPARRERHASRVACHGPL
jgi:hypothetical protein